MCQHPNTSKRSLLNNSETQKKNIESREIQMFWINIKAEREELFVVVVLSREIHWIY
jgi:hypothetical protein